MRLPSPALDNALRSHTFDVADDGRRTCAVCGLKIGPENAPSTLALARVPVCAPEADNDD